MLTTVQADLGSLKFVDLLPDTYPNDRGPILMSLLDCLLLQDRMKISVMATPTMRRKSRRRSRDTAGVVVVVKVTGAMRMRMRMTIVGMSRLSQMNSSSSPIWLRRRGRERLVKIRGG